MLVALSCCMLLATAADGKCRALAFGGAGDKGPFQVGALKGLIESLPAAET
jgi:hypothetical protein